MATCNFIRESHQNASAMRAVIRYVSQEKKTVDTDGRRYLSGVGCGGTCAYDEFLATKNLYRKTDGVWFYQYTQSFAPGEIDDPAAKERIDRLHRINRFKLFVMPSFDAGIPTAIEF